jgi:uncharacterized protein with HEPN domain
VKDERVYLLHAVEAIDAIARYTADGEQVFFSDAKTQDAVIRNIEIIGQAVKGIPMLRASATPRCRGDGSRGCATS